MTANSNRTHYARGSMVLHWLMAVLIVAVYALINLSDVFEKGSDARALTKHWHFSLGLTVFLLMVAMPILGWLVLSTKGRTIPFYGFELPALMGADKPLGRQLMDLHELGGTVGYFLIGGHPAVALFHHYFMNDNTLLRMWPLRKA